MSTPPPIFGTAPLVQDSDFRDRKLQEILRREDYDRNQLAPLYQRMVKHRRLYLSDRDDTRKAHERWRSNTFLPYAYSQTETKTAAECDILLSADPLIQAEGVGGEDAKNAAKLEHYLTNVFTKNRWPKNLDASIRSKIINGTNVWKVIYVKRQRVVLFHPTPEEMATFNEAVAKAAAVTGAKPPSDPKQFEEWRVMVNTANTKGDYPTVPQLPQAGPRTIMEYSGPEFQRANLFELRLDPMVEDWEQQEQIAQRVVRPWSWIKERTGPGKMFDPLQIEKAQSTGPDGGKFEQYEEQVAAMLGITATVAPTREDDPDAEILEVFRPLDKVCPYALVVNRRAICNNNVGTYPFGHGMQPYVPMHNVPIEGRALGMSDLYPAYRLYLEMNHLRDLRIDAVTLGVLPMFEKLANVGIPELQKKFAPGNIIEVQRPNALRRITSYDPGLEYGFREIDQLKGDIDETNSTPSHVRGGTVTLNRVSATEAERRYSSAIIRIKQHVLRDEEDMNRMIPKALFLEYQFGDPESRLRVGNSKDGTDFFRTYTREDFLRGVDYDLRFRGATRAQNRELTAQQLQSFIQLGSQLQILGAPVMMKLMRKQYEMLGLKGGDEIITDADIESAAKQVQQQKQLTDGTTKQTTDQMRDQNMETADPVPDEVELQ